VRAAATFLVVLGALVALPAAALATDQVVVQPEGASARTVSLTALGDPDVQAREYAVDDGTGERRVPITGHSLDRVLDAANVDPYRFGDVQVSGGGLSAIISRDEVTRSDAFPDGPPVFWMEQDGSSRFLRPGSDVGGPIQIGGDGPITVSLSRPSRLEVTATASKRRVKVGEPVTFTATVDGAREGEQVTVRWYFDDGGGRVTGTEVTHRFRRRNTYDVTVSATTSRDDPGDDAIVTVQVGRARAGPDRKGGGTNTDANAPDSGSGTATGGAEGSGSAGGGSAAAGNGDGSAGGDDGGSAGADDGGAETARDDAAAARRRAARRRAAARRRSEARARRREERDESIEAGASREVSGIELADLSALSSPAGRDAMQAARTGRMREEDEDGGGIPPGVWWSLGTAALLGLGGWREARGRPGSWLRG
jgi:PKD domain